MTDFSIGNTLRLTLFGQSHAPGLGAVIEGFPAGCTLSPRRIQAFLDRRAPGRSNLASQRKEADVPEIISGLNGEGKTCGAPLCALFRNTDARSADYAAMRYTPRPGHADFPAHVRMGDNFDYRGGGEFSGRMTAALCFAGAVCLQELERRGIRLQAHICRLGFEPFDQNTVEDAQPDFLAPLFPLYPTGAFPVIDENARAHMTERIAQISEQGDSIGGEIRCIASGVPAGLGGPLFGGVEGRLSAALFGIPAVKGVFFGEPAALGSINNDQYIYSPEENRVKTVTNRAGGVTGGITNGMPVYFTVQFKPTPSIVLSQRTVDLRTNEPAVLTVTGRHDPCILPRAVPVVEAVTAFTLLDLILSNREEGVHHYE